MIRNITVVIVEDDEGHALLIKRNLKRAGVLNTLLHFKNGDDVLNYFFGKETLNVDTDLRNFIILLDIKMPKVDGIEVLQKLKGNITTRNIPVIMITTTDNPREIDLCHKLGCDSYILKPIDFKAFMGIVNKLGYSLELSDSSNQ